MQLITAQELITGCRWPAADKAPGAGEDLHVL